jgi:protein-tyrosine phosphatase
VTEAAATDERGQPAFRVLAVCAGNICRSPAVERILRAELGGDSSVEIVSAGTQALVGHPIAGPMAELLEAQGVDPAGFVARQLTAPMLAEADLVLALSRDLRSAAVTLHPRALRRTFTLRELAALAAGVEPEAIEATAEGPSGAQRLRALLPLAVARRGYVRRESRDDDVVDPWRRSAAVYRESMQQMRTALDVLAPVIRG